MDRPSEKGRQSETLLTPSLPRCHLKSIIKSAKFETFKFFCFLASTGVLKDFHQNA